MPNSATFFASGKLFIVGEYSVVTGKAPAILIPTTKGIRITVRKSKKFKILNEQFKDHNQYFNSLAEIKEPLLRLAMEVVRQYVQEIKGEFSPFSMKITSQISSSEIKYGLGSSGALVTACIGCLLKFYGIKVSPLVRYKLAVKAVLDHQTSSSYADLAVSTFNEPLFYQKFEDTMQSRLKTLSVMNAIESEWDGLIINPLPKSPILRPLVIFTGVPASSSLFVSKVMPYVDEKRIQSMQLIVNKANKGVFSDSIQEANQWLKKLAEDSGQGLFTEEMKEILDIVEAHQGVGKFSGAGGGDCMIAYISNKDLEKKAIQLLNKKYKVLEGIIE
jgi:phosphomevalonate kinase